MKEIQTDLKVKWLVCASVQILNCLLGNANGSRVEAHVWLLRFRVGDHSLLLSPLNEATAVF